MPLHGIEKMKAFSPESIDELLKDCGLAGGEVFKVQGALTAHLREHFPSNPYIECQRKTKHFSDAWRKRRSGGAPAVKLGSNFFKKT